MSTEFPRTRRGYDIGRVDAHLATLAAELERLAADNRDLHRRLAGQPLPAPTATAATPTPGDADRLRAEAEATEIIRAGHEEARRVRTEAGAAQMEAIQAAHAEAERIHTEAELAATETVAAATTEAERIRSGLHAEVEAARGEVDRLVRARIEVYRELTELGEALRNWLGPAAHAQGEAFAVGAPKALVSSRTPPRPPPPRPPGAGRNPVDPRPVSPGER